MLIALSGPSGEGIRRLCQLRSPSRSSGRAPYSSGASSSAPTLSSIPAATTAPFFATSMRLWALAKAAKAKTAVANRVPGRPCAEVAAGRSSRRAKQAGCRSCSFLRFGCADPLPQLRCYLVVASRFGQVQGGISAMVGDVGVSARADQPVIACNEHSHPGQADGHPES